MQYAIKRTFMKANVFIMTLLLFGSLFAGAQAKKSDSKSQPNKPRQKVVELDSKGNKELPILSGPPQSYRMRSGLVVLSPGDSIGKHSTHQNEEVLVVLEGDGEMVFGDGSKLPVKANSALYCPPETEHNVVNTGTGLLRYVYVVSQAKQDS
jgi:mannose-6-phosphate isomerase-like protein (cupin superfamily)